MVQLFLKTKHFLHVHENVENTLLNRHILKSISKKTEKLFAVSNTTREALISCGVSDLKIEVLYNGTSIIPPKKKPKKNSLIIGIVGQVASHKGHELLIDALSLLNERNISFCLKIFGTGSQLYLNFLKNKIEAKGLENKIKWMGFQNNLDEVYCDMDVLLLPTIKEEPFGMVIIEAGVRNVLVLASNTGGPAEIIKQNQNGFLFESGNINDLALNLEDICKTSFQHTKIIDNNYNKICAEFDICKQAVKLKYMLLGRQHSEFK